MPFSYTATLAVPVAAAFVVMMLFGWIPSEIISSWFSISSTWGTVWGHLLTFVVIAIPVWLLLLRGVPKQLRPWFFPRP